MIKRHLSEQERERVYAKINERECKPRLAINADLALDILDELDAYRRTQNARGDIDNNDFTLRVACAMIARRAGFTDCMQWRDALRKDPNTTYYADKRDPDFMTTF